MNEKLRPAGACWAGREEEFKGDASLSVKILLKLTTNILNQ